MPNKNRLLCPLLVLVWIWGIFSLPALAANECVVCHERQKGVKYLEHDFDDWKNSIHAAKGVQCEACHGGNPKEADPAKAHNGVLSSRSEGSRVYFKNIPKTCGVCHQNEFKEFKKSVHYKLLQSPGKGPNCLTCHGSMATKILSQADLNQTCRLCHGKPVQAAQALSLIRSLQNSMALLQKKKGADKTKLRAFEDRFREIQSKWHSFDIAAVTALSTELLKEMREVR